MIEPGWYVAKGKKTRQHMVVQAWLEPSMLKKDDKPREIEPHVFLWNGGSIAREDFLEHFTLSHKINLGYSLEDAPTLVEVV